MSGHIDVKKKHIGLIKPSFDIRLKSADHAEELGLFTICTKVRRVKYVSTNNILYTGIDVFLEVGAIKHGLEKIFLFWDCRYTDDILYGNLSLFHKLSQIENSTACRNVQ